MGKELVLATKPFAQEHRARSWWHLGSTLAVLCVAITVTCLDIHWVLRLPFSILAGLVLVRMFILYHDYLHGAILDRSWFAGILFRVYGLLMLTPSSSWKGSHDHHHYHNGQNFGVRMGSFPLMTTDEYAHSTCWQRLGYRALRHPFLIMLGYVTVFLYNMCLRDFMKNPRQHLDAAVSLLIQATIITGLAILAPLILVLTFLVPVVLASALGAYLFYAQHNFPAARFSDRAGWDYADAALYSSSYLRMNPVLHWFTGNIGYHHVHHLNARIPFYRLPEALAEIKELHVAGTTSLHPRDIYRCLRLKLWDPHQNRLVTFREWARSSPRGKAASERSATLS